MEAEKIEGSKPEISIQMNPGLMRLKINTEITRHKLTISDLKQRAIAIVKNEDGLKQWADLLIELKKVKGLAEDVHETTKKPFLEGGRACDAGRKLVFDELKQIEDLFPNYQQLLANAAAKKRQQEANEALKKAILKGIEDNVINFSNRIVAARTRKDLTDVEFMINREKSPSMAKKYGDYHQQAIERYDTVLLPILRDQKVKVEDLEKLNAKLLEAEANNDPDTMDVLDAKINDLSNEILQNHARVEDAALNQESFSVAEVTEVFPESKVKRTNYSYELVDAAAAWKKDRNLLEITVNKDAAKIVLEELKKNGEFDDKDEIIVNGIKYIATRVREAL